MRTPDEMLPTEEDWEWIESLTDEQRATLHRYALWVMREALLNREASITPTTARRDYAVLKDFLNRPCVYLMHDEPAGEYKIGQSVNLLQRVKTLNRERYPESPFEGKVYVVSAIPYPKDELLRWERFWHQRFAEYCILGEWFRLSAEHIREFAEVAAIQIGEGGV